MYRKIATLLLIGFASAPASAQIPKVEFKHFFQLNKAYPYKYAFVTNQSPGNGGAAVVWDFSKLNFQIEVDTTVRIAPALTPAFLRCGIAGTDTADICLVNRSSKTFLNDDYHYYKTRAGKIMELGSDQDNGLNEDVNFQYARPRTFSPMPFTYMTKSIDSFRGTYFSYLSGPHVTWGVDSFLADGYGTLKVAGMIYDSCVRLKQVSYRVDSNAILGTNIYHSTLYTWYSRGKEGPVLTMEPYGHSNIAAKYYFPRTPPAGIKNAGFDYRFSIYPNPATNQLYILFKSTPAVPSGLNLFNTLGQLVLTQKWFGHSDRIDISRLPNGFYRLRASDKDGRFYEASFIKQ